MEASTLWLYCLVAGVVVILIVAILLLLIVVTARSIDRHAKNIWTVGKNIAANTVSIWMLRETNGIAENILSGAGVIATTAQSIDDKLGAVAAMLG